MKSIAMKVLSLSLALMMLLVLSPVTALADGSISVNPTSITLAPGQTANIQGTCSIWGIDNTNPWTTTNSGVATVSDKGAANNGAIRNGVIRAVSAGSAKIGYQKHFKGPTVYCTVTVRIPVQSIAVFKPSIILSKDSSYRLQVTFNPSNATNKNLSWCSSNSSIASVDGSGNVRAVGGGTTSITVKSMDTGVAAACTVRVFTPRTDKNAPSWGSTPYYPANHYGLPWSNGNCVAYAYARATEILGYQPNILGGDARMWWTNNLDRKLFSFGQTPKVGAIAVWGYSYNKADPYYACGHVAIVENIVGSDVYVSQSSYGSWPFGYSKVSYARQFLGYIYLSDSQ